MESREQNPDCVPRLWDHLHDWLILKHCTEHRGLVPDRHMVVRYPHRSMGPKAAMLMFSCLCPSNIKSSPGSGTGNREEISAQKKVKELATLMFLLNQSNSNVR